MRDANSVGSSAYHLEGGVYGKSLYLLLHFVNLKLLFKIKSIKNVGEMYEVTNKNTKCFLTTLPSSFYIWISLHKVYSKNKKQDVYKTITACN